MISLRAWLSQRWVPMDAPLNVAGRETTKRRLLKDGTPELGASVQSAECYSMNLRTVYRVTLGPAIDAGSELARIDEGIAKTEACLEKAMGKPGNLKCVSDLRKKLARQRKAREEWMRGHPGEAD